MGWTLPQVRCLSLRDFNDCMKYRTDYINAQNKGS